jgi:hypothetical protein
MPHAMARTAARDPEIANGIAQVFANTSRMEAAPCRRCFNNNPAEPVIQMRLIG